MKIAIAGTGYVGPYNAMLHEVVTSAVIPEKVDMLNNKQLSTLDTEVERFLASFQNVPSTLVRAVDTNRIRKDHIADSILQRKPSVVGIHRLVMKLDSDNSRASAIQGIIKRTTAKGVEIVYEPDLRGEGNSRVENNLDAFKENSNIIVVNEKYSDFNDVLDTVYT